MKILKLLFMLSILSVISACNDSNMINKNLNNKDETTIDETNSNMSNFPKGVQDGKISVEYYNAISKYLDGIDNYVSETNKLRNNDSYSTEERFEKQVELNNKKIVMINSIETNPINKIEREIEDYFYDTLYYDESATNYLSKYLTTNDKSYKTLMESNLNSYNQSSDVFTKILMEYKIVE